MKQKRTPREQPTHFMEQNPGAEKSCAIPYIIYLSVNPETPT